jgi:enolase
VLPRVEVGPEGAEASTAVGDEGGFAPNLKSNEQASKCWSKPSRRLQARERHRPRLDARVGVHKKGRMSEAEAKPKKSGDG